MGPGGESSSIFAAEVLGKRASDNVGEDELTSRILGVFDHLDIEVQTAFLRSLGISEELRLDSVDVMFWPKLSRARESKELDAIITLNDRRIAFEFKWGSPGDASQLIGERTLLDPDDVLIYVTNHNVVPPEVGHAQAELPSDWTLHWIPWREWLRAAKRTKEETRDRRDAHLLDDIISYMEVLGMTDWQRGLEKYWRISADRSTIEAFQGLSQFFKELRTQLKDKHGDQYRIGEAQTVFAYKSWVELTPATIQAFAENLAVYVVLNHDDQSWEFTFELKSAPREPADRARERIKDLHLDDVEIGAGDVIAKRPFVPNSDFTSPADMMSEIEDGLLRFADGVSRALSP